MVVIEITTINIFTKLFFLSCVLPHLKCTWMNNLISTCFFHINEIVKDQFNNHLLVELIFYKHSPASFSYVIVITTCSLRWFLCMNFFTLLFLVETIQKNFYKIIF